jgi:Pyruvate/2-oxoacid:ferredoxin oxidoreductase delta subunit
MAIGRFDSANGSGFSDSAPHRIDVTDLDEREVVQRIEAELERCDVQPNRPGKWKPWFPVIDFARCTNCMQCLSFCLFDVYGTTSDGQIQVQNNPNCKTDCPACSRVCPEAAIMFPKYDGGPINGEEVRDGDVRSESMKVDISALLGGDIYEKLRERSVGAKNRFAKERDEKHALSERIRCLREMGVDVSLDLASLVALPSAGEIQENADQARRKAQSEGEVGEGSADQGPSQ